MQHVAGEPMNPVREYVESTILQIREEMLTSPFDCRELLTKYSHPEYDWNMTEEFRDGYIVPKYAVAKVLQPKRICEIGVYTGIAALSFLGACPQAEYLGIDNLSGEKWGTVPIVENTKEILRRQGYNARVLIDDSQRMQELPGGLYDLIHVDGCHTRGAARHDVMIAFKALTPEGWLLVDDGCDCHVCTGTFDAMLELPGGNIYWTYLEGTTGSILIHKRRQ